MVFEIFRAGVSELHYTPSKAIRTRTIGKYKMLQCGTNLPPPGVGAGLLRFLRAFIPEVPVHSFSVIGTR